MSSAAEPGPGSMVSVVPPLLRRLPSFGSALTPPHELSGKLTLPAPFTVLAHCAPPLPDTTDPLTCAPSIPPALPEGPGLRPFPCAPPAPGLLPATVTC